MTCPLPLRHPTDLASASRWGANCGPASLAAALSLELEQVRAAVSGGGRTFRGWMGVPEMLAALRWLDVGVRRTWSRLAWPALLEQRLEGPVLAMLEYAGPWPASEAAKHRHWVAFGHSLTRRPSVYDVNAGEWLDEPLWRGGVLPPLLRGLGGDGRWSLSWAGELRVARPQPKPERVVLVDGNNLVHRLFHARPLEFDVEGRPVNAINGWAHALRKLREQHQPDEFVAVFDGPGATWRHELLPGYKASRRPAPEALRAQWTGVVAVCERLCVPWVRRPNLEADDVIAELALAAAERGHEVLLVSSDKDLMQLLRGEGGAGSIRQVLADGRVVGTEHVVAKFGVGPELLADYLALVGDRQDDVPGVRGIGAKTAVALLREFAGLEQLLAGVERVGDRKVRCRLRAGAEAARLSRRLVGVGGGDHGLHGSGYHGAVSATDVLIVCALKDELDALLEVSTGVHSGWTRQDGDPEYWTATLDGAAGPLQVAAARATAMGGIVAGALLERLATQLEPKYVAMCGVCAGHPDDTDLGDVIIADRVFQHDNGKLTEGGFRGDLATHMPDDRWVRLAQELAGPAKGVHGYAEPDDSAAAKWWFLERLYTNRDPRKSGFARYIAAEHRAAFLEGLLADELVRLKGEEFSLTKTGREAAARRRAIHGAPLVAAPCHIHVGPIGSGNYVVARRDDWDRIADQGMRKVIGLEMEVAAIGAIAYRLRKPFVVAKGVMDHGDKHKTDRFKAFAARASAEVLCTFLRRVVEAGARVEPPSDPARFEGPTPDTYFTGREHELAELEQLVKENRTVCVVATGIGGIGKTTLVAEFAATRGRALFPDGVAWLEGSPEQLVGELDRVCRRFGWADDRAPTVDEAQSHLKAVLEGQRVLLVVDNFDPAKSSPKQVPMPGGSSRTLVTSRSRTLDVDLDARSLELGVWSPAACREYLRARCDRLRTVADAEVDALAEFVGRLPLGVKLLVSVLRHRAGTGVGDLLDLLRARPLGTLDKYAQEHGVAATFRVAYDDLPEPAKQVLQALAVCARQTRRAVVASVCERDDVGEPLDDLHARGFAELSEGGLWGMHDVVRMFVLEQPGREVFGQRHTAWVRAHLESHSDPTAYRAFAEGVDEARHAFERLLACNRDEAMTIYWPLEDHLTVVGRFPEAMALSERVLAVVSAESRESSSALNKLGVCYGTLGDIPKAIELFERSLAIEEKLDHLEGQATALGNLGVCYRTLGDIPKAIELHERSLAIEEKLGRLEGQANQLGNLGVCYEPLGNIPKAIELHERSLAIEEKLGRLKGQASDLGNLGLCYGTLGDIPKAIELHERSLAIDEKLGRLEGQASSLGNLGLCYRRLGDIPKAIELLERSLAIEEKLGRLEGQASSLGNLGLCYRTLGDIPKAIELLERSLACERRLGRSDEHPSIANKLRLLAELR